MCTLQRSKDFVDEKPIGSEQHKRRSTQIRTEIEQRTVEMSSAGRHVDETHERTPLETIKSNLFEINCSIRPVRRKRGPRPV